MSSLRLFHIVLGLSSSPLRGSCECECELHSSLLQYQFTHCGRAQRAGAMFINMLISFGAACLRPSACAEQYLNISRISQSNHAKMHAQTAHMRVQVPFFIRGDGALCRSSRPRRRRLGTRRTGSDWRPTDTARSHKRAQISTYPTPNRHNAK